LQRTLRLSDGKSFSFGFVHKIKLFQSIKLDFRIAVVVFSPQNFQQIATRVVANTSSKQSPISADVTLEKGKSEKI